MNVGFIRIKNQRQYDPFTRCSTLIVTNLIIRNESSLHSYPKLSKLHFFTTLRNEPIYCSMNKIKAMAKTSFL